jgi:hypothetical protein
MFRAKLIIFRELAEHHKTLYKNVDGYNLYTFVFYIEFIDNNSLNMIQINRNMSELWQIGWKKYNFNISAFVVLLCELFINARTWIN